MTAIERLRDKAASLPLSPGVYLMKDEDGKILYVGKSKKLQNRVSSYFNNAPHNAKTSRMVSLVRDFDYILCDTEMEALALENVLIKKHTPKYNIKLKDAKSYPYIKVTNEPFPRFFVTRERTSDRAHYYGPYSGSAGAHAALEAVMKIFSLPTCKRSFPRDIGKERPCIYRDMGRCVAPCAGGVTSEDYLRLVRGAELVLAGNIRETRLLLENEMREAAENENYEAAAVLRDSIRAVDKLCEKQKVVADAGINRDVFAMFTSETEGVLAMLSVRDGAVVRKNEFILSVSDLTSPDDAVCLIADYYDGVGTAPREIMLDFPLSDDDIALLSDYLTKLSDHRVYVRVPERGDGRRICDLALENAKEAARQYRLEGEREDKNVRRLAELLSLAEVPKRIEAYDISNIGNESIVASMIVYKDARLKKSDYRLFSIRTTGGADDFGSMREALSRRLSHLGDGSLSLGETPDLILLDGGVGQVHAVRDVLREMRLDLPLFGMVKDDYHKTRAITDGEREISIAKEIGVYGFVYKLQEEAHRFAVTSSAKNKIRTMTHSSLEKIPGIGPSKAKALLAAMPLAKIRTATAGELAAVRSISGKDAEEIVRYYRQKKKGT